MAGINYSFVIPHKNCPDLLRRCISSIPEREDIQIIVVDDNSDDDKVPHNLRHDVEFVGISKQDSRGAGHARNAGLERATGQWVLFADADDYYSENFMEMLDEYKESDNDVIYFNFAVDMGCHLRDEDKAVWQEAQDNISKQNKDYVRYRFHTPWNKMVARTFIQKHHIRFEETIIGNDVQFALLLGYYLQKHAIIDQPLYHYYTNNHSLSYGYRSTEKLLLIVEGWYKVNAFNSYIHHTEWNTNPYIGLLFMLWYNKKRALNIFGRYMIKLPSILRNKNKYVELITSSGKK